MSQAPNLHLSDAVVNQQYNYSDILFFVTDEERVILARFQYTEVIYTGNERQDGLLTSAPGLP